MPQLLVPKMEMIIDSISQNLEEYKWVISWDVLRLKPGTLEITLKVMHLYWMLSKSPIQIGNYFQLLFSHQAVSNSPWPHGLQHACSPVPRHLPQFAQVHAHCTDDAEKSTSSSDVLPPLLRSIPLT